MGIWKSVTEGPAGIVSVDSGCIEAATQFVALVEASKTSMRRSGIIRHRNACASLGELADMIVSIAMIFQESRLHKQHPTCSVCGKELGRFASRPPR